MGWFIPHDWTDPEWLVSRRGPTVVNRRSVGAQLLWLVHGRTALATAPSADQVLEGQAYLRYARCNPVLQSLPSVRLTGPWGDVTASVVHAFARIRTLLDNTPREQLWAAYVSNASPEHRLRAMLRSRLLSVNYPSSHAFETLYLPRVAASDMLDDVAPASTLT